MNYIRNFVLSVTTIFSVIPPFGCKNDTSLSSKQAGPEYKVTIAWKKISAISKTSLTIEAFLTPQMRPDHPLHDSIFAALRDLKSDFARYASWYCYPRLGIAELEAPKNCNTSWDFSLVDPPVLDFYKAAEGRPVAFCMATIPQWMFKTDKPVPYPVDPNEVCWGYCKGDRLRDTTLKEVADYYHRVASWYLKGGFTDEFGTCHKSGHNLKFDYWEVGNENDQDTQHGLNPRQYTDIYDAVVGDLHQLDPGMKFCGLALSNPVGAGSKFIGYFLDSRNHKPGIPLDMISYHFYAYPGNKWLEGKQLEDQKFSFFKQADNFINTVIRLDSIRQSLSPSTLIYINEFGSFSAGPQDGQAGIDNKVPSFYWQLSGAMFAYAYPHLVKSGVDIIALAELFDFPGQYAGATSIDWNTGRPNARYRVLKLLHDNFGPGDQLPESGKQDSAFLAQAFITSKSERKLLIVNKTSRKLNISVRGAGGSNMDYVDETIGNSPHATIRLKNNNILLNPYAVAVLQMTK